MVPADGRIVPATLTSCEVPLHPLTAVLTIRTTQLKYFGNDITF